MSNPNILLANAIFGHTDRASVGTLSTVLVSNPAGSGKVFRVTNVTFTNVDSTARLVTLNHHDQAAGAGAAQAIASAESVPAAGRLTPVTRDMPIYLEPNTSLAAVAVTASTIRAIVTYEEIA